MQMQAVMRALVAFCALLSAVHVDGSAPKKPTYALATCKMVANCGQETCVKGTLTLKQKTKGGPTTIFGVLKNVFPAGEHGWHVHEFAIRNTTEGCGSAGGHFNPLDQTHGAPDAEVRHVGDLGNLVSKGEKGAVVLKQKDEFVSLVGDGDTSVVGRTIVIHGGPDDLGLGVGDAEEGSLASGNSGPRIGCCEIVPKTKF